MKFSLALSILSLLGVAVALPAAENPLEGTMPRVTSFFLHLLHAVSPITLTLATPPSFSPPAPLTLTYILTSPSARQGQCATYCGNACPNTAGNSKSLIAIAFIPPLTRQNLCDVLQEE